MKNKKRTTNTKDQKVYFLDKVRENPKLPRNIMLLFLLFVLPFCIIFIVTSILTMKHIRNDAYTYTDEAYNQITTAIMGGPLILEDGTVKELPPCVQKEVGIDVMTLKQFVDSFSLNYENGHTILVCAIKKGYFTAEVTVDLFDDYEVLSMKQNFDSLGQYMDSLLHIFVLSVLLFSLAIYIVLALLTVIPFGVYGAIYRRIKRKKKAIAELEFISLDEKNENDSPSTDEKGETKSLEVGEKSKSSSLGESILPSSEGPLNMGLAAISSTTP